MAPFVHPPLDLATRCIRVLRIKPGENPIIVCEMQTSVLSDHHVCLSYTWGDEPASMQISINGAEYFVRPNLWSFLEAARNMKVNDWLWIDAVCIDQSNIKERNHQVQQMADIYQQARYVVVWVGYVDDVLHHLIKISAALYLDEYNAKHIAPGLNILLVMARLRWYKLYFAIRPTALNALWNLMSHPYWMRLWVIQELHLAKKGYILTGGRWISLNVFSDFIKSWASVYSKHPLSSEIRLLFDKAKELPAKRQPLTNLLFWFSKWNCVDVLDHVYGFLGLCEEGSGFSVDYSISPGRLLYDVLLRCLGSWDNNKGWMRFWDISSLVSPLASALRVNLSVMCLDCCRNEYGAIDLQNPCDSVQAQLDTFETQRYVTVLCSDSRIAPGLGQLEESQAVELKNGMLCVKCQVPQNFYEFGWWGYVKMIRVASECAVLQFEDVKWTHGRERQGRLAKAFEVPQWRAVRHPHEGSTGVSPALSIASNW